MAVKENINIDDATVAGFGDEWSRFNQNGLSREAREQIFEKLKSGAPFLVYFYYSFDCRGVVYRGVLKASDMVRRLVSRMPFGLRYWVSQVLALIVYWPLARGALLLDRFGIFPGRWPLAYYKEKPFYVLRTDALDRFGTRLEQRFSRVEIWTMLEDAGFTDIRISDKPPYWCAVGIKG